MWRIRRGKQQGQRDSESGATAVEFALVLPILALILCGIFDIGNLFFNLDVVNNAARQGARLAAVSPSSGQTAQQIITSLQNSYSSQLIIPSFTIPAAGSNVTVTVKNNVTIITPIMRQFFTNPYTVEGTCTMYVE